MLQHRKNYLAWLVADTTTQLGASLRGFAIPVLVLVTGGTAIQAGSLSSITAFVIALMTIIGGVVVDRYNRKKLLLISTALGTVIFTVFSLWVALIGFSFVMLVSLAVVTGIRSGILGSVSNVLLRNVVDPKELPRAISINQGRDAVVEIIASPLSGFIIGIKAIIPLIVEAVINAVAFCAAWFIHPLPESSEESDKTIEEPISVSDSKSAEGMTGDYSLENVPVSTNINTDNEVVDLVTEAVEVTDKKKSPIGALKSIFVEAASAIPFLLRSPITSRVAIASVTYFPLLTALLMLLIFHTIETGHSAIAAGMVNTGVAIGVLIGAAISTVIVQKIATGTITLLAFVVPLIFASAALLSPFLWLRIILITPLCVILPAGNAAFGGFGMLLVPQQMIGRYTAIIRLGELIMFPLAMLFVGFGLTYLGELLTGGILIAGMMLVVFIIIHPQILKIPTPEKWEGYLESLKL